MAKRKKSDPEAPSGPPDLLDLLTPPGEEGRYDREIALPADAPPFIPYGATLPPLGVAGEPTSEHHQPSGPAAGETSPSDGPDEACPASDSMERIRQDGLACTACALYQTRTHFVLGEGPVPADLVFIGEAPGADEDATGRPFVGRAGQHLDKILTAAGFRRDEVYICNILKDRPPENRTPTLEEMRACTPLLQRQLAILRPKLIALLGNTAVKYVIGPDAPGITKIHGQWFNSIFGIPCMPMYHPSYLLRNQSRAVGSPNWEMWQDIQALKKRYDEVRSG